MDDEIERLKRSEVFAWKNANLIEKARQCAITECELLKQHVALLQAELIRIQSESRAPEDE